MSRRWVRYSTAEIEWISANRTLPAPELHSAFCNVFGRNDVSKSNLVCLRKRKGWKTGRTGRFPKGNISYNAGRKGTYSPGSEKGWFAKGSRHGLALENYKPIGSERLSRNGYLERKIHDGLPLQSRWRAVYRINWEAANGPLPKGMALKCLDGDRTNTSPENWEAIPRAILPRLVGGNRRQVRMIAYDDAPAEVKPALLAVAKLQHQIRQRRSR